MALTVAAKHDVKVTLILPAKADSLVVCYTSHAYYPMLLGADVKITMFEGSLLHTKTMTIDEDYFLFSTVDMDMRSFFLSLETSLIIYGRDTTKQICSLQCDYLKSSSHIAIRSWQQRLKFRGLIENAVRLMSPLL